ncbi:UNVERIFIED_CONTAM: hypothetical protein Slati_3252200 [Sesamum latifolium]|uniref:Uncharacterized protein n=1 Tax=Sesamum latifolium TaxID=2727402 RepID=A0AAW2V001_9LAMI
MFTKEVLYHCKKNGFCFFSGTTERFIRWDLMHRKREACLGSDARPFTYFSLEINGLPLMNTTYLKMFDELGRRDAEIGRWQIARESGKRNGIWEKESRIKQEVVKLRISKGR